MVCVGGGDETAVTVGSGEVESPVKACYNRWGETCEGGGKGEDGEDVRGKWFKSWGACVFFGRGLYKKH